MSSQPTEPDFDLLSDLLIQIIGTNGNPPNYEKSITSFVIERVLDKLTTAIPSLAFPLQSAAVDFINNFDTDLLI